MDFGSALARLFVQAGRPTLRAAAARSTVSAQRISDWRNGRHLPRDFATVEPLLLWLAHPLYEWRAGAAFPFGDFPPLGVLACHVAFAVAVDDTLFYWLHRLLHHHFVADVEPGTLLEHDASESVESGPLH